MHAWGIWLQNNYYESSLLAIIHTNLTEILLYKPIMCTVFCLREATQVNPNIVRIAPRLTEICSVYVKARKDIRTSFG